MRNKGVELINEELSFSRWFYISILGIISGIFIFVGIEHGILHPVFFVIPALILMYGLLLSREKTFILVQANELILRRDWFGRIRDSIYSIKLIEDIALHQNVKSNVYTSNMKVKVLGMDMTPESAKNYYYHKEVISFKYQGKKVHIGRWKKSFDAASIVREIREKQLVR